MMSVLYILEEAAANSLAFRFDLRSEMSVYGLGRIGDLF